MLSLLGVIIGILLLLDWQQSPRKPTQPHSRPPSGTNLHSRPCTSDAGTRNGKSTPKQASGYG
jgi:hypothetical protein